MLIKSMQFFIPKPHFQVMYGLMKIYTELLCQMIIVSCFNQRMNLDSRFFISWLNWTLRTNKPPTYSCTFYCVASSVEDLAEVVPQGSWRSPPTFATLPVRRLQAGGHRCAIMEKRPEKKLCLRKYSFHLMPHTLFCSVVLTSSSSWRDGAFSDVVIHCGATTWNLHRVIISQF